MTISIAPETTALFLLLFARIGALVMLMPALGEQQVPARIRLAFALAMTLVFYPFTAGTLPAGVAGDGPRLIVAMIGELFVGLSFGLLMRLILSATQVAGASIANAIGLSFAQTVDPTMGQQGAILGSFLSIAGMVLIFALDLHHIAIAGIASSYDMFPPGGEILLVDMKDTAVMTIAEAFKIGIQISAPFMVLGLVFNLGLGVLAKLMPQLQVFFLAMPVSIGAGLILFALLVATILGWYAGHVEDALMRLIGS